MDLDNQNLPPLDLSQIQSQPENLSPSGPASSLDTSHLEAIATGDDPAGIAGEGAAPAEQFVTLDVFHATFCGMFNLVSGMSGLQSLHVEGDADTSRAASKAVYETACEVPALHFLVSPGGKWAERAFALFAFSAPMVMGVKAELAARRKPAKSNGPRLVETAPTGDSGLSAFPVDAKAAA